MDESVADYFFDMLKTSVEQLAAPASAQIALMHSFRDAMSVDELAIEFDDMFVLAWQLVDSGYLTPAQFELLRTIDHQIDRMSKEGDLYSEELWHEDALQSDVRWATVRELASQFLTSRFDIPRHDGKLDA